MRKQVFLCATFVIVFGFFSVIRSQDDPCWPGVERQPIPDMWVANGLSSGLIKNFDSIKRPEIEERTRTKQNEMIKLGNCLGLWEYFFKSIPNYKYLKVYLGIYPNKPQTPAGYSGQLTLFFSPADMSGKDLREDSFYMIKPDARFALDHLEDAMIGRDFKEDLESTYRKNMAIRSIDILNEENECTDCNVSGKTDTRSILYEKDSLQQLIIEQKYCHSDRNDGSEISITKDLVAKFGAMNWRPKGGKVNMRIVALWSFTTANFVPMDLEKTARNSAWPIWDKGDFSIDNGQLCPTVCKP